MELMASIEPHGPLIHLSINRPPVAVRHRYIGLAILASQ